MKHNLIIVSKIIAIFISLSLFMACEKNEEETEPVNSKLRITSASSISGNHEIELFANDSLFEGYNPLFFILRDKASGVIISHAEIQLFPLMDMITMVHSAPFENPAPVADENDLFEGAVVFLMPSTPDMGWTIDVVFEDGGNTDTAKLVLPKVKNLEEARKINVISELDETKYFVSLAQPVDPAVGINDFELVVNYKENMMSFPPATDLTIEIEPEMPSMDHGSPNNENPVHQGNGHYLGKVNFTMTGWWRVHLRIYKAGELIAHDTYFDITF